MQQSIISSHQFLSTVLPPLFFNWSSVPSLPGNVSQRHLHKLGTLHLIHNFVYATYLAGGVSRKKKMSSAQGTPTFERLASLSNSEDVRPEFKLNFAPIDLLDYIYAVLHSPTYREKYKEFLKIDFPRVPYPKDQNTFWQLVKLGGEIRQIHLLESPTVEKYITQYPIDGNNVMAK